MVNGTVGTTIEGNIDPIEAIGKVCQKHNIWYHIDAALAGSLFVSEKYRNKIGNCKAVDSVTWDPHKALVVPLQASFFFCKHDGLMLEANSSKADYLFMKERASYSGSLDTGDKSLQCGRNIDILKLWVYLKGNGWKNIGKQVDAEHEMALYAQEYMKKHSENFELLYNEVDSFCVSFYALPNSLKLKNFKSED